MKIRALHSALVLAAALLLSACQFQQKSNVIAPGNGSGTGAGGTPVSNTDGSLLGTWSSEAFTIPTGLSCTNFQWHITSQTDTTLTGDFTIDCSGNISVEGSGEGRVLSKTEVSVTVHGTANGDGLPACAFELTGTGTLIDENTIRIPYSGTTCLGPVHGTETLKRRTDPAPPPPAPAPPPPAPPAPNQNHVPPGPLTVDRAHQVLVATGNEFPNLTAPQPTENASIAATTELLRRMIWHLDLAGYQAARQRNPSGAISQDKLTIFIDGRWHAYDVFVGLGTPNRAAQIGMLEVAPANPTADPGIPD